MLSIVYVTFRTEPKFEWFCDGLVREFGGKVDAQVIFVDGRLWYDGSRRREGLASIVAGRFAYEHVPPKPSVWQGPHRLTGRDYSSAANSRNTGLALARGDHVIFSDDLAVLMPGWLAGHRAAARGRYVLANLTHKHNKLVVDRRGLLVRWEAFPPGQDSRLPFLHSYAHLACHPNWLYGGGFSLPLEAALQVNGLDEMCDAVGAGEDYDFGIRLGRAGWPMKITRIGYRVEADDLHHSQPGLTRQDKAIAGPEGPDGGHAMLKRLFRETDRVTTVSRLYDLRELRQRVLRGDPFPVPTEPQRDWRDGQPLSEM